MNKQTLKHKGLSWRACAACYAKAQQLAHLYHPDSDVGPFDGACPDCGHLHGGLRCPPISQADDTPTFATLFNRALAAERAVAVADVQPPGASAREYAARDRAREAVVHAHMAVEAECRRLYAALGGTTDTSE